MLETLLTDWKVLAFFVLVICYYESMRLIDQRWANRGPLSDSEHLTFMARKRGISEYELFRIAAKTWNLPESRVDTDFKDYLLHEHMPHYLKDLVRRDRLAQNGPLHADREDTDRTA